MTLWHKSLESRFSKFPLEQQILMVCNELNRAHNNRTEEQEYRQGLERALELLDFLVQGPHEYSFLREIFRARDVIAAAYLEKPQPTKGLQDMLIKLNPQAWRLVNSF